MRTVVYKKVSRNFVRTPAMRGEFTLGWIVENCRDLTCHNNTFLVVPVSFFCTDLFSIPVCFSNLVYQ